MGSQENAADILRECVGQAGVWASPTRYRNQCWTRDLGIVLAPVMVSLGYGSTVDKHLNRLTVLQRPDGKIPILFLDNEQEWLADKRAKEALQGRKSFMLTRYEEGELGNLTPGTTDSELAFILAVQHAGHPERYAQAVEKALAFVEINRLDTDGMFIGCDWRDTLHKELADKTLLTNNCLLYRVYQVTGQTHKAEALRQNIISKHFKQGACLDYPGGEFDPLGASFAVLYGVAHPEQYGAITRGFQAVDTPVGVSIHCKHNPQTPQEAAVIERTDGKVVWPFVVGFTTLAMRAAGLPEAAQQYAKLTALDGHYEWYDPLDGTGYGAPRQAWSAAMCLRASPPVR